jgi:1-acyl-sn-glycerol-3-phosphate acyltransferase
MKQDGQLNRAWQFAQASVIGGWYGFLRRCGGVIDGESGVIEQRVAQLMSERILRQFDLRVEVEGAERAAGIDRRYCIVSNHASYLDWVVHLAHAPKCPAFIAKKEVTYYPVVGPYLRSRGVLIDRKAGFGARKAIAQAAEDNAPWPILIFPEGTRSRDGEVQEFKRGGLHAIAQAGMPMLPAVIIGSHEALPRGKPTIRRNRRMKLIIGDPVEPEAFETTAALIQHLHGWIKHTYDSRRGEILDALPASEPALSPAVEADGHSG